jgi:hypothetical protein
MSNDRLETFRVMVARQPAHAMARFGLATELAKIGSHAEAAEHFAQYLGMHDDEGNGWLRYAESLRHVDRIADARAAIEKGIEAANRHQHPTLVGDLEAFLDTLD